MAHSQLSTPLEAVGALVTEIAVCKENNTLIGMPSSYLDPKELPGRLKMGNRKREKQ